MGSSKKKLVSVLATVAVIGGAIVYLFAASAGEAFEYYKHVDEVMSEPAKWEGKHLQLHGFVVPGSIARRIDKDHQQVEYKFQTVNCGSTIDVRYEGTVPDTFKDRAEVVMKGSLAPGLFTAREISAKCPSKYSTKADGPQVTLCTRGDKNVEGASAAAPSSAPLQAPAPVKVN